MAKEQNTIPTRIPKKVYEDLDNALKERFKNNLISRRDMKLAEGFRLIGRTPEWNQALERLKKFPKREDVKRL